MAESNQAATPAIITGAGAPNVNRPSRFEAPYHRPWTRPVSDRLTAWIAEAVQDGEAFMRMQTGWNFVDASHRIMADKGFDELPPTLSKASDNFVKRGVRELVGTLSNPRPLASFKADNPDFATQADIVNKGYLHWYNACFVDRSIRSSLQYAAVEGTGYSLIEWDPGFWGTGRGDIRLTPLGVDAVLPIQICPDDWDLQGAYAVIIRRQLPITSVMRRFPQFADMLSPDGDTTSRWRRLVNSMADKVRATVHNTYGSQRGYRGEDPAGRQLVTIYDTYIMDAQVNSSDRPMLRGVEGSPWEYTVPFLGQELPTGVVSERTGMPITRKADYHDARLFPYRRHIVSTRNLVLYDDTSRYWHGQVPVTKFTLDDWPFEYCGVPVTKEPAKLQAMITSLLRAKDDSSNARLRPPIAYSDQHINPQLARSIDPRVGGQMFAFPNMLGEPFKVMIDPRYYQMDNDAMQIVEWAKEEGSRLMGLHDLVAMQKAAQIPAGDTIEKMMEAAGPLTTDMARNMERSLRDMAEMFKALFFEFYTAKRRFQLFGPDGLTPEDYDFDPGQLVPKELDLPGLGLGGTRAERARAHMQNFHFTIVPNSVYQMTQSTRRLLLLQLARMGMPIDPRFLMDQFDIPNPDKMIEDFWAYKQEEALKMTETQILVQSAMGAMNPMAQMAQSIQGALGTGGQQGPGRPPTGQVAPHPEVKDGGTRVAIAES